MRSLEFAALARGLALAGVVLFPAAAQAIERYDVDGRSCADAQAIVQREGAAILRYRAPRSGQILYDRYVRDGELCQAYSTAVVDYIRTADNPSCPVYHCVRTDTLPGSFGR